MKQIPLTQGQFALVDDEDYDYLNQWKWCANHDGYNFYAVRGKPLIRMHRVVLGITNPKICVDHINRNTLDNRRCNLRTATYSQNSANRRAKKNGTSIFLGVALEGGAWRARIQNNGRKYHLGSFNDEYEAARAYDEFAKKLHGDFASLNFSHK